MIGRKFFLLSNCNLQLIFTLVSWKVGSWLLYLCVWVSRSKVLVRIASFPRDSGTPIRGPVRLSVRHGLSTDRALGARISTVTSC